MNIIAADDERRALRTLEKAIRSAAPDAILSCFESADQVLEYAQGHVVDVAFLDIELREMNGLELARKLREINAGTNIIFVTGYREHMGTAFDMHASGYVLKPIDPARVADELNHLRNNTFPAGSGSDIHIQCFGKFEIFVHGRPVLFKRSKAKEIIAYLVDREGASVSRKDLAAVLWEDGLYDRNRQKQLQNLVDEMKRALREVGAENLVMQEKGHFYLNTKIVDCDYYNFEQTGKEAFGAYRGEYMSNYSWAELTAAMLSGKALQGD